MRGISSINLYWYLFSSLLLNWPMLEICNVLCTSHCVVFIMFPPHGTGPWEGAFNQQERWNNYWWWFQNKRFIEVPKLLTHLVQVTGLPGPAVISLLVTNSLVTVYLSPVWVLAQCCILTLAFSLRVTIPTSTLSWLSIPWHWPTNIYICPSLSLLLPLNIGLPKTPPGLILDRCHEPCPSVISNTDQPRPNQDPARTGISPIPSCSRSTSNLLLFRVCHRGEAKAASPDGRLHQS